MTIVELEAKVTDKLLSPFSHAWYHFFHSQAPVLSIKQAIRSAIPMCKIDETLRPEHLFEGFPIFSDTI